MEERPAEETVSDEHTLASATDGRENTLASETDGRDLTLPSADTFAGDMGAREDTIADERTLSDERALAYAQTMALQSAGATMPPLDVATGDPGVDALPAPAFVASRDAGPEDTSVFYERVLRSQTEQPASGAAESYEIVASIGRGGMGEVWRAVQRSLGREVALKQLTTDDPAAAMHFLSEARVTARLAHSNIVPVHALGRTGEGRPMLAMKLVKGTSWADLLHAPGAPRDLGRNLEILVSVCNAVAFAHSEGFLHRDLKPANVMVAEYGQVFLVDWGLAVGLDRRVCDEHGILHVHDVKHPAGTPAYMAPELATGNGSAQGPWTDVYLLGSCLHEVATGSAPHTGKDTVAALRSAMESRPLEYGDEVPRELAEICRRAMARLPSDRYPDVRSLRAAVEAFMAHAAARAITEKGTRALERLRGLVASAKGTAQKGESRNSESQKGDVRKGESQEAESQKGGIRRGESQKGESQKGDVRKGDSHSSGVFEGESLKGGEVDGQALSQAIHATYTESRFAFEHALESWPEDEDARRGLAEAARVMLGYAIGAQDLALALRLRGEVEDPDLLARVEALRARMAAREAELTSLREQATLLDDRRVARPVGRVFIVAGVMGGAAILPTRFFLDKGTAAATIPITVLWTVTTLVTGVYAFLALRGGKKSLMSGRIGWTWAAVGAACLVAGAIAMLQGEAPFHNAAYTTMMIAIGFVAQAMQTRRWLLVPAGGAFLGALAMGVFPSARVEIFGVLWVVTLTGVGVALRRGARLDGDEPAPSRVL